MAHVSTEAGSSAQSDSASNAGEESFRGSSDRGNTTEEEDENGRSRMTLKWITKELKRDWKTYYRTAELNEKLYFHCKGFQKIEHLDMFPDLKCLYFEQNGTTQISGLESNPKLICLYLHENVIQKIENLDNLAELRVLNLSDNLITTVEGLAGCEKLDSLMLARNRIGKNGLDDLKGLIECPAIVSLDLQNNHIQDEAILPEILMKLPNLKVLYLQNNPVVKKITNYRKTLINAIPSLTYLDDRPVFKDDRRNAEAFARGGNEEERKERQKIKDEEKERHDRNHNAFRAMMAQAREEKRLADEKARKERGEPEPSEKKKSEDEKYEKKLQAIHEAQHTGATVEDVASDEDEEEDDEAPPVLEAVTQEELKKEWAEMSDEQKQEQKMYEGLKDAQKVDLDELAPKPTTSASEEVPKPDNKEELKQQEPENKEGEGQCSNLEELD